VALLLRSLWSPEQEDQLAVRSRHSPARCASAPARTSVSIPAKRNGATPTASNSRNCAPSAIPPTTASLPWRFAAAATVRQASCNFGWRGWPMQPRSRRDRSCRPREYRRRPARRCRPRGNSRRRLQQDLHHRLGVTAPRQLSRRQAAEAELRQQGDLRALAARRKARRRHHRPSFGDAFHPRGDHTRGATIEQPSHHAVIALGNPHPGRHAEIMAVAAICTAQSIGMLLCSRSIHSASYPAPFAMRAISPVRAPRTPSDRTGWPAANRASREGNAASESGSWRFRLRQD